jgi:serine/threonine-protein kinase
VGQLIGERYQIERKLGQGGMGEVYLARHVLMDRPCAIKVLNPNLTKDPDSIGRFNREATNASRINHPNVCGVYDFGLTPDGLVYLAMEYIQGQTLSQILADGPMPLDRAVGIIRQCADGLEAAHALGIVHRDLKPDNIMFGGPGGRETVKLVDFGIAKSTQGQGGNRVTQTGLVVGTPEYMSPEQLAGDSVDGRSDQYSLALVLYRMLTGKVPFAADTAHETMARRLTERPEPLTQAAPERRYPAALDLVLGRALERRPADRYASVSEFAQAVRQAVERTPESKPPEPHLPRTRQSAVANPWPTRAAISVGVLLAVAGGYYLAQRWSRRGDTTTTTPPATSPAPAVAATTDSTIRADSGVRSIPPSAPSPAPSAPSSSPEAPPAQREVVEPALEEFDDPASARATDAADRARLIANNAGRPIEQRARMAMALGSHYLDLHNLPEANRWFTMGCRLHPRSDCSHLIEQTAKVP